MVEIIFRLPGCVSLSLPDGFPRQAHFSCKTKTLSTGMSSLEDKMAATTARSIAGSSTLRFMLRKRLCQSLKPALFPERLNHIQSLGVVDCVGNKVCWISIIGYHPTVHAQYLKSISASHFRNTQNQIRTKCSNVSRFKTVKRCQPYVLFWAAMFPVFW
jgi:hypothetical protein